MRFRRRQSDRWVVAVETDGLSHAQIVEACRTALGHVRDEADRLQIEVSWARADSWPAEVTDAATVFVSGTKDYETSGWITPVDDTRWNAYLLVAPYVDGSDVWSDSMEPLADVGHEGTSIVLHVRDRDIQSLRESLAPIAVTVHLPRRSRLGLR